MPLELESFHGAVGSLRQALEHSEDAVLMNSLDETLRNVVQSGVIKHFEFTYELSWKFIKRWLEANVSPRACRQIELPSVKSLYFRHSRESGNPESPAVAERCGYGNTWIPAFAGMTR